MPSTRAVLLVAGLAAIAGAVASVYFEPTIATRLAATEPGQRVLGAVLGANAPAIPKGVIVAKRGGIVPNFRLKSTNGKVVPIPVVWAGRPTLVNLWATWCAPCLKEMPELQAYAHEQGGNGTQVVGIALDDEAAVQAFLDQYAITYPNLIDAPGSADAGVRLGNPRGVLPFSVLVSAEGRVLKTKIGPFHGKQDITDWTRP